MSTTTTGDLEVVIPEGAQVEVVELEAGTEVVVEKQVTGLEVEVTGTGAVAGKAVNASTVTVQAEKGETATVVLQTNRFVKSDIAVEGKGKGVVKVNTGVFNKSTVTGGKKGDSVSFGGQTKVKKGEVDCGKGNDTVTFKKNTTFQGKTTIDLGKGGKDAVEYGKAPKGGKCVIENFSKKDTITVGKNTFDYKDIKNGAEIPGVKVKLA